MTDRVSVEDNEKLFKDAPDWVNWIAMDRDLSTFYYKKKPIIDLSLDFEGDIYAIWYAEGNTVECHIKMDCHWSHSLIERVR